MAERDQIILVGRQAILLVTAMGVGLLTLSYVLGVQVGKQSAALRKPLAKSVDEQLKELPEPLAEQLKLFEGVDAANPEKATKPPAKTEESKSESAKTEAAKTPVSKPEPKKPEEKKPEAKTQAKPEEGAWTLQLVSTADPAEAKRVADKAKAAGYVTTALKEKGQIKVRLAKPAPRPDMDAIAAKLKGKGLKSFPVKLP